MDRHEFETLAIAELEAVYRFARFLTRSGVETDDLVQEVYARAFRPESVAALRSGSSMRAWLMSITRSLFYSRLEHDRAGRRAVERLVRTAEDQIIEAPTASAVAGLDWPGVDAILAAALDSLGPELRDVLWLWAVEGLKYREISSAIDVPIGTVMSRLHRARSQVAREILRAGSPPRSDQRSFTPRTPRSFPGKVTP